MHNGPGAGLGEEIGAGMVGGKVAVNEPLPNGGGLGCSANVCDHAQALRSGADIRRADVGGAMIGAHIPAGRIIAGSRGHFEIAVGEQIVTVNHNAADTRIGRDHAAIGYERPVGRVAGHQRVHLDIVDVNVARFR